jgi:hypothetical protein
MCGCGGVGNWKWNGRLYYAGLAPLAEDRQRCEGLGSLSRIVPATMPAGKTIPSHGPAPFEGASQRSVQARASPGLSGVALVRSRRGPGASGGVPIVHGDEVILAKEFHILHTPELQS